MLHVSVLTWPSSGLLTNQVDRCWLHLLTWFVIRPDDGHVKTETCSITHNICSQHLLTWFVRRPDDGHVRTETCSITHNTCSQHLLTWFVRRPDDGHVRTETCSITHNKICVWRKLFYYFNITHSEYAILTARKRLIAYLVACSITFVAILLNTVLWIVLLPYLLGLEKLRDFPRWLWYRTITFVSLSCSLWIR